MRAVYFEQHGGPEVLKVIERPRLEVEPDQVLIEVRAAGLNPRDWDAASRDGLCAPSGWPVADHSGSDVSGVIAELGEQVDGFSVGDEVVAMQSILGRMGGSVIMRHSPRAGRR